MTERHDSVPVYGRKALFPRLQFRVRLPVGIAAVFLMVMVPLLATMTAVLYQQNSRVTIEVAAGAMDTASASTVANVRELIGPVMSTVQLWTMIGKSTELRFSRAEVATVLLKALQQLPAVYSLYYGFENDGAFLQVIRLPADLKHFGAENRPLPPGAYYVVRTIEGRAGAGIERYTYYAQDERLLIQEFVGLSRFDPRDRPWYEAALATDGIARTDVYLFNSVDQPGLTFSQRVTDGSGNVIGVFGADILTTTFSDFLAAHKVGERGVLFIFDGAGKVVAYPEAAKMVTREGGQVVVTDISSIEDDRVLRAVRERHAGHGDRFRTVSEETGRTQLASFTYLGTELGQNWTIGVLVDEDEFVAPLRHASTIILAVGLGTLLIACLYIMYVSRLLTRPIAALIQETRRLRRFELDTPFHLHTRISEIYALIEALSAMKAALRSFGRYVPKEIVRDLVARGDDVAVGGGRRTVTVMFTDIAGFTKTTETWAPERVLDDLSEYFETLSTAILSYRGTIDKFIGDGIMAFWNAPTSDMQHAAHACLAALACRAIGRQRRSESADAFHTRFGLHTGTAVVGNVGSQERLQYTALGSMVNLTSRIEALNKQFGTEILISETVESAVRGAFELRPLGKVVAFGTSQPIEIFELLGTVGKDSSYPVSLEERDRIQLWTNAYTAYTQRRWPRASDAFAAYLARYPDDRAAALMQGKCRSYLEGTSSDEIPQLEFIEK
jgi:adenylate cyclase